VLRTVPAKGGRIIFCPSLPPHTWADSFSWMSPRRIAKTLAAIGIAALIIIVVAAAWIIKSRERERDVLSHTVSVIPGSLLHARNFHWTQMKGEKEQWQLVASEANYGEDRSSLTLKDTKLSMVLDDGKPLAVRADRVNLSLSGNNHVNRAEFSGGLVLDYGDIRLKTGGGTFLPDSDLLEAPGPVEIAGDGFKITGVGLEAKPRARTFELKHQVTTDLTKAGRTAAKRS
jgi:LPS export ABC transporter protein LptC